MKNSIDLVEYAKKQIGKPYWYGTYGNISTTSLYNYKKQQYPKNYTDKDFLNQLGVKVHDCVGLIKGYLWSDNAESAAKYNKDQDVSASGMYINGCVTKGLTKDKYPSLPHGALLFVGSSPSKITHVGIYDKTSNTVIEAKGHRYGVVRSSFDINKWNYWGLCRWVDYNEQSKNSSITNNKEIKYIVKPGDTLTKISRLYNKDVMEIAEKNNIKNINLIRVGQELLI